MRLTDIPAFFTATPKTAPTPAIAISSVPAFNNTIAGKATLSLQQRWAELELKSSVDSEIPVGFNQYNFKTMYRSQILQPLIRDSYKNCMVYQILLDGCKMTVIYRTQTYFCMATFRRRSHCMIMLLLSCIKSLLFLLQKAICQNKVRNHDEHLADEEKYKTYCDIPIGPIYINVKYFHSGSILGQNSHLYSRFLKKGQSKYIDKDDNGRVLFDLNHQTTIHCHNYEIAENGETFV
ncbi:uncharacterized protein EV154DRAFT_488560 [Mucor mucedo]|uniref:uncharacterized protein n=1 Tax=Mucor mucedo TaxID=29922 RepID=UPI00221EE441|nr:uncharacterized protein EV154DRAFT_488560 [Mucor mucedo]KAI7866388.1 hypothetical protein EV154DRAFT_488560 [Mucor mucedo]